ncbi:MAG TPA: hypothetical protein H9761_12570 [Candidatus Eisenbergiella merdavium]|uniref:Uncharacterized protein n=1 Tax=Candidatus Eisenbergiella merdavium TaxID=2838551 RepID=A0A9D2SRH9_9FIRM|nr:hypothetical protein [Candidatus Eisenbergiella merdavium]
MEVEKGCFSLCFFQLHSLASLEELEHIFNTIHCWYTVRNVANAVLLLFRNWTAYGLLLLTLAGGELSASEFVYYIGLASSFALYFEILIRQLMSINSTSASVGYIREFLSWQDAWKRHDGIGAEALNLKALNMHAARLGAFAPCRTAQLVHKCFYFFTLSYCLP